jgi:hypothetical protein
MITPTSLVSSLDSQQRPFGINPVDPVSFPFELTSVPISPAVLHLRGDPQAPRGFCIRSTLRIERQGLSLAHDEVSLTFAPRHAPCFRHHGLCLGLLCFQLAFIFVSIAVMFSTLTLEELSRLTRARKFWIPNDNHVTRSLKPFPMNGAESASQRSWMALGGPPSLVLFVLSVRDRSFARKWTQCNLLEHFQRSLQFYCPCIRRNKIQFEISVEKTMERKPFLCQACNLAVDSSKVDVDEVQHLASGVQETP